MPTLVLLRHGKSAYPDGVGDHERPLNERGHAEAPIAGRRLLETFTSMGNSRGVVDSVLVSTATRAQQTWEHVEREIKPASVATSDELYLADVEELADIVRGLDVTVETALIVGHNEGLEDFASYLTDRDVTLKTSTFAVLVCDQPWAAWQQGAADLHSVVVAR